MRLALGLNEKQRSVTFLRNANLAFFQVSESETPQPKEARMKTFAMGTISMQASNNRDRLVVILLLLVSFDFLVGDSCIPPCQPGYVCCGGDRVCAFSRCSGHYCVAPSQCSSGESCGHSRCVDHPDCSGEPCTHESDCGGDSYCRGTRRFLFATGHFAPNSQNIGFENVSLAFRSFLCTFSWATDPLNNVLIP